MPQRYPSVFFKFNSGSTKATVQTVTNTNPRASAPDAGQVRLTDTALS